MFTGRDLRLYVALNVPICQGFDVKLKGAGGAGGAGLFFFSTLFHLHNHVIQLVTSPKMLRCCIIHLLDCFDGNVLFTTR